METYIQQEDITVFGKQVRTFPNGIPQAFEALMKDVGEGRVFYGISWLDDKDSVVYYAAAAEKFAGEAKQFSFETFVIEKGEYYSQALHNWMSNTDKIKEFFSSLMPQIWPDRSHPCIEWYQSNIDKLCMVKVPKT